MRSYLILATLRSVLATLLVLKTTAYWCRLPELDELHSCCIRAAACVGKEPDDIPAGPEKRTSGRTAAMLNRRPSPGTDGVRGCRRNDALPTIPELTKPSLEPAHPNPDPEQVPAV
jgi:hypothetical protein